MKGSASGPSASPSLTSDVAIGATAGRRGEGERCSCSHCHWPGAAVAIFRQRLWEIDPVISWAVAYGLLWGGDSREQRGCKPSWCPPRPMR